MFAYSWDAATDVIELSGESAEILGIGNRTTQGTDIMAMVHPDDKDRLWAAIAKPTVENPNLNIIYRIIRPDGAVRWLDQNSLAYFDEDGKRNRIVGMIADITERKQAEESRLRLAAIVESSEDAIISKNPEGIITSWNASAQRIFGYKEQEVAGKSIYVLIPPELWGEEKQILEKLRAGEHIEPFETIRATKAGKRVNVSLTISPITDSTGRIVGFSKIARDITERKLAEEALRDSEKRFQLAAQTGNMYSFEWNLTTDELVLSPEHTKVVGIIEPLRSTRQLDMKGIHPEDRERLIAAVAGVTPENPTCNFVYRVPVADGGFLWLRGSGHAIFDSDGKMLRMIGTVMDITDLKRAEHAVVEMTRKWVDTQE